MTIKRRAASTPHPGNVPLPPRMFFDIADRNNTTFNGSDVQGIKGKSPSAVDMTQTIAVSQPADGGTDLYFDDPSNEQFMSAGADFILSDETHSGLTMMFLVKHTQTTTQKFVYDIGGFAGEGYGVDYTGVRMGCYTPILHGGAQTIKNPVSSPTDGFAVIAVVIEFGVAQKMYMNNSLEATTAIPGLSRLDATTVAALASRNSGAGPSVIGTTSKTPPGNRIWKGNFKNALIYLEALSDYQRKILYIYQRNKILV